MIPETEEKIKNGRIIDPKYLQGKWKIIYTPENTLGAEAFGGKMLEPFSHPVTNKMVYPLDGNDKPMIGYFIGNLNTWLMPDKEVNRAHYNAVLFCLAHPEVMLEGIDIDSKFGRMKYSNSKVKMINLDLQASDEFDDQEIIDRVIGTLSLDTGKNAVGLERMQWILAQINKPFIDKRYIDNPAQLKKQFRKILKDHVRKSSKNALEIEGIINNIEDAKKMYVVKSLIELGVLEVGHGAIKHNGYPLGHNLEAVVDYLTMNTEHWVTLQNVLDKSK